jgi:hypothetical protein
MSVAKSVRQSMPTDLVTRRRASVVGLTLVVGGTAYFARRPHNLEGNGQNGVDKVDDEMRRRDELMRRLKMSRVGRGRRDRRHLDRERMRRLYEFQLQEESSKPRTTYDELFADSK